MKDDGFFYHKLSLVLFKYCKCHQHMIYCAGLLKREADTELGWARCGMICRVIYSRFRSSSGVSLPRGFDGLVYMDYKDVFWKENFLLDGPFYSLCQENNFS